MKDKHDTSTEEMDFRTLEEKIRDVILEELEAEEHEIHIQITDKGVYWSFNKEELK